MVLKGPLLIAIPARLAAVPAAFAADRNPVNSNVTGAERLDPSIEENVYGLVQKSAHMSTVTRLIDTVNIASLIERLSPLTFFSPVNSAWDIIIPSLEIEDVLKNHMFEELLFDDVLANMHGEQLTSINGKAWNVQVMTNSASTNLAALQSRQTTMIPVIYISNADGDDGLTNCSIVAGPNRTNILANNGMIHRIDCLFLDYNYTRSNSFAPTWAPISQTAQPVMVLVPPASGPSSTSFAVSFFGHWQLSASLIVVLAATLS